MDDEEILRSMVGQMLSWLGYEVELAKDGVEAVKIFCRARNSSAPFDVVILDIIIDGGMGRKETLQKLRAIDPYAKAIVSIGHSSNPVAADFRGSDLTVCCKSPIRCENWQRHYSK